MTAGPASRSVASRLGRSLAAVLADYLLDAIDRGAIPIAGRIDPRR